MSDACCAAQRPADEEPPSPPPSRPSERTGPAPALPASLVELPGGTFAMGNDDALANPGDGEGPVREVEVGPFWIDAHTVSNARFAAFVEATGHVTEAERYDWSFVFAGLLDPQVVARSQYPVGTPWWCAVPGSSWRHPEGPGSTAEDRADHPAVHIGWTDAVAYAEWAGMRLPTETEWEYAARGGLDRARYPWGDDLTPEGEWRCNIWQGRFPDHNTLDDGHLGTAPVDAFAPNGFGLHNTVGNVWEWTSDLWEGGPARVMRGGSYLCHDSYCNRYRVAARSSNTPDSSSGNLGFRCVADLPRGDS